MGASLSQSCTPCLDGGSQEPEVPEINWKLLSWHACHKAVEEVKLCMQWGSRVMHSGDHDSTLLAFTRRVARAHPRVTRFAPPLTARRENGVISPPCMFARRASQLSMSFD